MHIFLSTITVGLVVVPLLFLGRRYFAGAKCNIDKDLQGQIIIVTGSSAGVGLETAKALAKKHATLIFACRNPEKTEKVISTLKQETGNEKMHFLRLDLNDLNSVKNFADNFNRTYSRLDVLINNAGILGPPDRHVTKDGLEGHFSTHFLGPYYLTNLLLNTLKKAEHGRIVNVNSFGHEFGKFYWDDLQCEKDYHVMKAYDQSKLANMAWVSAMSKQLEGTNVKIVALHPGVVRSEGFRYINRNPFINFLNKVNYPGLLYFAKNSEQGAQTSLYCAMEDYDKLKNGGYYSDCRLRMDRVNPESLKEENQKRILDIADKIIHEKVTV